MQWSNLLSQERFGCSEDMPYDETRYPIGEFEKDYSKIINSASFRRLQDKTQVFPLDKSDFLLPSASDPWPWPTSPPISPPAGIP